jgi:protein TonB
MRIPLRRLVRPTPGAAFAASLGIHGASFAAALALQLWMLRTRDSVEFSGKRNVVQIELACSTFAGAPIAPVTIEPANAEPLLQEKAPEDTARAQLPDVREMHVVRMAPSLANIAVLTAKSPPQENVADAPHADRRELTLKPSSRNREPKLTRRRSPSPSPAVPQITAPQIAGTDDQTPPDFSGNRKPEYPTAAYRNGIEGEVLLRLWIDEEGRVSQAKVERTSGHDVLDRAAVAAVRTWRGRPARRGDQPVATEELLPVRFRLSSR